MSALSSSKNGFGLYTRRMSKGKTIILEGCILAIVLTGVLRGVAQNPAALASNVGMVDGTVEDVSGAVVPKAELTLKCLLPCRIQTTVANDAGGFEFRNLTLGVAYQLAATATGFKEWRSSTILLTADRSNILLSDVRIEPEDVSVTVYASREQIATEQVKIAEQQRVLGIVPNFFVIYDSKNAVPLSTKLKFKLAMRVAVDPVTIAGVAILAGIKQAGDKPDWPQGAKGYGQRFGANYADGVSDILIGGAVLPSLLHQDPRYFYQGTGTTTSRLKHALFSPFVCRGDNGKPQVNFSSLGGDLATAALANTYYPDSNRGPGLVFGNFAVGTAERMLSGVIQEFVLRKLTPSAKSK
jgi:Carboxypeptidase regulatory-like domain